MPVFLGVHEFGQAQTGDDMKQRWTEYQQACKKQGCEAWKLYYNTKEGKAYCVTEAASAEDVKAAHKGINQPKEIVEVQKIS